VGEPAKVRHVGGYAPFIEFCAGRGVRAEELASDPERLISFLRTFGSHFENDSTLSAAASVFAGNAIARLRPDAQWAAYEGAPPTVGNRHRQFEVDRLLVAVGSANEDSLRGFVSALLDWAREEVNESPAIQPVSGITDAGTAPLCPAVPADGDLLLPRR
jgi:hypothetical protein